MSDEIIRRLDKILEQTTKTNGRLTKAEDAINELQDNLKDVREVVFGDDQRQSKGLIMLSYEVGAMIRAHQTAMKIGKWLLGATGTVLVAFVISLFGGS